MISSLGDDVKPSAVSPLTILGDPGADKGGEGKSKRAEKYGTKESKERREEPLGTMSYQTSSNGPHYLPLGLRGCPLTTHINF